MSDFDNGLTISGNIGLGMIPSAWDANVTGIQVKNTFGTGNLVIAAASGNAVNVGSNWYYNTNYKYSVSGLYANNTQTNAGVVSWNIAPTGTAGNNITWITQMTLDTAGNLGLGIAPKAWISPGKVIEAGTYAAFGQGRGGTSDLVVSWNGAVTSGTSSGTGYVYKTTGDLASSYEQNGTHRWYTAPSGTAGNAITFTQSMVLDANGSLGLGVTPQTWGFSIKALELAGGAFASQNSTISQWHQNSYTNATGLTYKTTAPASAITQNNGQVYIAVAPSGTAGTAATFTTALTVDNGGNVAVGANYFNNTSLGANFVGLSVNGPSLVANGPNNLSIRTNIAGTVAAPTYASSSPAAYYQQIMGAHLFYAAASGTGGASVSFTQLLSLAKSNTLSLEGSTQTTGTGIAFPSTQLASSDANTLDDYEEGTWTPSLTRDGTAPTGITYNSQSGAYTKIGRMVRAQFSININAISTQGTGNWLIQSLPFTAGGSSTIASGSIGISGILSGVTSSCYTNPGSSFIYPILSGQANSTSTAATGVMSGSITYFV